MRAFLSGGGTVKALLIALGAKRDWLAFTPCYNKKGLFSWEEHSQIVLIVTGNEQYLEPESCSGLTGDFKHPLAQETFLVLWVSCAL